MFAIKPVILKYVYLNYRIVLAPHSVCDNDNKPEKDESDAQKHSMPLW